MHFVTLRLSMVVDSYHSCNFCANDNLVFSFKSYFSVVSKECSNNTKPRNTFGVSLVCSDITDRFKDIFTTSKGCSDIITTLQAVSRAVWGNHTCRARICAQTTTNAKDAARQQCLADRWADAGVVLVLFTGHPIYAFSMIYS